MKLTAAARLAGATTAIVYAVRVGKSICESALRTKRDKRERQLGTDKAESVTSFDEFRHGAAAR